MLTPKYVLENFGEVKKRVETRGPFGRLMDEFREVTLNEREKLRELEELRARKNKLSEQVIKDKTAGKETGALIPGGKRIGEQINSLGEEMAGLAKRWDELIQIIPNIPHESVPVGKSTDTTHP